MHCSTISIFNTLRTEILEGKYSLSDKFPSEQQLVRRFKVSRTTVRLALSKFKESGIITTSKGSGTRLCSNIYKMIGRLGLIVPHLCDGELAEPLCAAICRIAREAGYSLLFEDSKCYNPASQGTYAMSLAREYISQGVAGVFMSPIELVHDAASINERIVKLLKSHTIPVVLLDRDIVPPPDHSDCDVIGIDNYQAGYRLATHLAERGAKRICLFAERHSAPTVKMRFQGARDAILDKNLKWTSRSVCLAQSNDSKSIQHFFCRKAPPDAFLCANDITAVSLLNTLTSIGIKVPDDVLLAGVDDIRLAAHTSPPLTTIHQPCDAIARTAVSTMLQRLREPSLPARKILLDAQLVIRDSSGSHSSR